MRAKLISPVWVVIERKDTASTIMNDHAREPVKQAARTVSVRLKAQVSYSKTIANAFFRGGQGGISPETSGHLVFLTRDIARAGVTFEQGDRITEIGRRAVEYYFDEREDAGHNRGEAELQVWNFIDHNPTKN